MQCIVLMVRYSEQRPLPMLVGGNALIGLQQAHGVTSAESLCN